MSFGTVMPKHERLANHLRQQIASGELRPGDSIPSKHELMEQHSMGWVTIRHALALLKNEGLLQGRPGEGVYVCDFNSTREARIAELIRSAPLAKEAISRIRALLRQGA